MEVFGYTEKEDWCFLKIESVGSVLTKKEMLKDGIYATFICSIMEASNAKDSNKLEEILKVYKIVADRFLEGKI